MKGTAVGTLVIIGLIAWWLMRRARPAPTGVVPLPYESEYEKLHKVVPITKHIEVEIPVYRTIEEWEANHA